MSAVISIGGLTMPPPNLQSNYFPTGGNMSKKCYQCHIVHDLRLNPNAKEFIPRQPVGIENTMPFGSDVHPFRVFTPHHIKSVLGPANRRLPSLLPGLMRETRAIPSPAAVLDTCSAHTNGGQLTGQPATLTSGVTREAKPAKAAHEAASRCTVTEPEAKAAAGGGAAAAGSPDFPPSGPRRRAADNLPQRGDKEVNQKRNTMTVQNGGTEQPTVQNSDTERLTVQDSDTERPTVQDSDTERPTVQDSDTERPTVQNGDTERPTVQNSDTERPTVQNGGTERPTVQNGGTVWPTVQDSGTELPTTLPSARDSFIISPTSVAETGLCRKIASVRVSPGSDVPCCAASRDPVNTSDISKRTRSPSHCSDSTKPRRSSSRESRANNRLMCEQPAVTAASTVIPCQPSSSTSDLETPSECDAPAFTSGRWRMLSSSSISISAESSDDSSDESSDEDSTLGDEWDASAATFLPSSSADSADDFIHFVSECCPTVLTTSYTSSNTIPRTPVFGPCSDQVDSGLSAETDPSDSEAADSSDDELSEDECESCLSAPAGTCTTHQRIAEANRQFPRWCDTPPPQPRTSKVRFLSGDRLATVHAAPDYDRGIASDLLDQQRQRDRLQRWRQDVELQVAPVLAAVLTPEHRQRVLHERPELLRNS